MTEIASAWQLRLALLRWVLVFVPALLLLGFLSARWSGSGPDNAWFAMLEKPGTYPPPVVFGLVWSALYALMGVALAIVVAARAAPGRLAAVGAFAVQLALNLAWSPLFFGAHRISGALQLILAIDVAVAVTLWLFAKVRPLAAGLLVPYLAWVLFASVLNWQILQANPGADGQQAASVLRIQL